MSKHITDELKDAGVAIALSTTSGAPAATAVDATGYSRAQFRFQFGPNDNTTAALSGSMGVWAATTQGGTYAAIAGAALGAVTSGVLSNNVMVIDTAIPAAKPWLKISGGSVISSLITYGATVALYDGISRPPTTGAQQLVVIG